MYTQEGIFVYSPARKNHPQSQSGQGIEAHSKKVCMYFVSTCIRGAVRPRRVLTRPPTPRIIADKRRANPERTIKPEIRPRPDSDPFLQASRAAGYPPATMKGRTPRPRRGCRNLHALPDQRPPTPSMRISADFRGGLTGGRVNEPRTNPGKMHP